MKSKVVQIVSEIAEPISNDLGLVIEEIEYAKKKYRHEFNNIYFKARW